MSRAWRTVAVLAAVTACVTLDQYTKVLAIRHLAPMRAIVWGFPADWSPNDLFHLTYAENEGAFLGFGGRLPDGARFWLLTGLNFAILAVVAGIVAFRRQIDTSTICALALILSGGVGNLIDRLFRDGRVVDFMNMGIGSLRTGVFNVADVAIMAGLFLILFAEIIRIFHRPPVEEKNEEAA